MSQREQDTFVEDKIANKTPKTRILMVIIFFKGLFTE